MKEGDWKSRVAALQRERPAQVAMLAAILAALGVLLAWTFALLPAATDIRGQPVFWMMAIPAMVWMGALQGYSAWAVRTLPLALVAAPVLALGALLEAPGRLDVPAGREGPGTPTVMAVIFGVTVALALVGAVALRRSSLPGSGRPARFLPAGTALAGPTISAGARGALAVGSLSLSGTLINGVFFGIIAVLPAQDGVAPDFGASWVAMLPAALVVATLVLMIRGSVRLRRGNPRGAGDLLLSWRIGAAGSVLLLVLTWAWTVPLVVKGVFSLFMLPMAVAAAWGGHSAKRRLDDAPEGRRS